MRNEKVQHNGRYECRLFFLIILYIYTYIFRDDNHFGQYMIQMMDFNTKI